MFILVSLKHFNSYFNRYKNVFCAICNGMSEIDYTGCKYTFEPSDLFIDFTMVIALSTEETIQIIEAERCLLGHIFIPVIVSKNL
jgi:hypothetical protein